MWIYIFIILVAVILYKLQPPHTIEIPDTREYYETGYIGDTKLFADRYCISINPPKNESEIIDFMLDYCRENREDLESIGDYQTKMNVNVYLIRFYRENIYFNRTWKPENCKDSEEEIKEFAKYLLGSVKYYSDGDENVYIKIRKNNDIHNDTEYTLKKSDVFK